MIPFLLIILMPIAIFGMLYLLTSCSNFENASRYPDRIPNHEFTLMTSFIAKFSTFRILRTGKKYQIQVRMPFWFVYGYVDECREQEEAQTELDQIVTAWKTWLNSPMSKTEVIAVAKVRDKI